MYPPVEDIVFCLLFPRPEWVVAQAVMSDPSGVVMSDPWVALFDPWVAYSVPWVAYFVPWVVMSDPWVVYFVPWVAWVVCSVPAVGACFDQGVGECYVPLAGMLGDLLRQLQIVQL